MRQVRSRLKHPGWKKCATFCLAMANNVYSDMFFLSSSDLEGDNISTLSPSYFTHNSISGRDSPFLSDPHFLSTASIFDEPFEMSDFQILGHVGQDDKVESRAFGADDTRHYASTDVTSVRAPSSMVETYSELASAKGNSEVTPSPASAMKTRKRRLFKRIEKGSNLYGRKGKLRCKPCREWKRKVSSPVLVSRVNNYLVRIQSP
jgi:hypothetical protein